MSSSFALPSLWTAPGYSVRTNACIESLKRTPSTRWSRDLAKSCQVVPSALKDSILHTQSAFREGAEATKVVIKRITGKATQNDSVGVHLTRQSVHLMRSLMHLAEAGICIVLSPVLVAKPRLVVPLHRVMGLEGSWGLPAGGAAHQLARLVAAGKDYAHVGFEKLKHNRTAVVLLVSVTTVLGLALLMSGKKSSAPSPHIDPPPTEPPVPGEEKLPKPSLPIGFCPWPMDVFTALGIPKPQPIEPQPVLPQTIWLGFYNSNNVPRNSSVGALLPNEVSKNPDYTGGAGVPPFSWLAGVPEDTSPTPTPPSRNGNFNGSLGAGISPLSLEKDADTIPIPPPPLSNPVGPPLEKKNFELWSYIQPDNPLSHIMSGIALFALFAVSVVAYTCRGKTPKVEGRGARSLSKRKAEDSDSRKGPLREGEGEGSGSPNGSSRGQNGKRVSWDSFSNGLSTSVSSNPSNGLSTPVSSNPSNGLSTPVSSNPSTGKGSGMPTPLSERAVQPAMSKQGKKKKKDG